MVEQPLWQLLTAAVEELAPEVAVASTTPAPRDHREPTDQELDEESSRLAVN